MAVLQQQDKHKARDVYRVTSTAQEDDKVGIQKEWQGKLRAKVYYTDEKRLVKVGQASLPVPKVADAPTVKEKYDPVNKGLWEDDDDIYEEAEESLWKDGVLFERQAEPEVVHHQEEEAAVVDELQHPEPPDIQQPIEDEVHEEPEQVVVEINNQPEINVGGNQHDQVAVEEALGYDQSHKPRKGEVISYAIEMGTEHERWAEATITSVPRKWPHFYNIQRLDTKERLGVYLYPNTAWHLGHRLENERAPQLHPDSRESSPILLRREEREFRYEFEMDYINEPTEKSGGLGDSWQ